MMKKVVIFTSNGGGGHTSASHAIKEYLKDEFDIHVVLFMQTILKDIDLLRIVTRGKKKGEDIYNFLMRKKWFRMTNVLYYSGRFMSHVGKKLIKPRIKNYLIKHKIDIFVSVVPVFNHIFLEVTEELDIPFFLVPTDLDATTFVADIKKPTYKKFHITQAFQDPEIKNTIAKIGINDSQLHIVDFPIRPDFFEKKDTYLLKNTYNVVPHKPVIMVLMGAIGSDESYRYVKQLTKVNTPFHLLVCIGKNEALQEKINQVHLPKHISLTTIGFTDRISDVMAIADLFITKSGTVSVCEGIYMNLPTLLDHTSPSMLWEHFNLNFIKKNGFGDVINSYKDIKPLVEKYLLDEQLLSLTKKRLSSYEKRHFGTNFKKLLKQHALN